MFGGGGKRGTGKQAGPPPIDYVPPQREVRPAEVNVSVNGTPLRVPSTWTILRACRENGIHVPTLCHHPLVPPTGRCGACVVSVEGRTPPIVKACKTLVEDGMAVSTDTPEVAYMSQANLREFLGAHPLESLCEGGLSNSTEMEDLVRLSGAALERLKSGGGNQRLQQRQYAIVRDQARCISCTRCVRTCSGVQNMNILSIDPDRPMQPISFEHDLPLHMTDCIACGQCTLVCPTGAVRERSDVDDVFAEICKPKDSPERKILILQTAPSARLSVGEAMGEEPGKTVVGKVVAAAHQIGFDYVFDTSFAADTTATLEAEEILDRVRNGGPFPMFTSCCPGWVKLVENKYPHLRPLLSRCKSPMMMLGAMIGDWMEQRKIERSRYCVIAMMPCTAKKEEILKPELRDHNGDNTVDFVLTAREMSRLLKRCKVDWPSLPGEFKATYDEPFGVCSGAGALFGAAGGVTEAALRVAYTVIAKEAPVDPERNLYEECRRVVAAGEWVDVQIPVMPDKAVGKQKQLDTVIVSGARNIQQFLEEVGIECSLEGFTRKGARMFVECMACPGGCIGGGGQICSLDEHVVAKRRAGIHSADKSSKFLTPLQSQGYFQDTFLSGITSKKARELLEYDPPLIMAKNKSKSMKAKTATDKKSAADSLATSATGFCGDTVVLFGSQGGITASFARKLLPMLQPEVESTVGLFALDSFAFEKLPQVETVIILTSTWESEDGRLMPENARRFWDHLVNVPHALQGSWLLGTKFALLGFGSSRYTHFCGFAVQLNGMLRRFGATPFVPFTKVDVERPDKGKKKFVMWAQSVCHSLRTPELPAPSLLVIPSVAAGGSAGSMRATAEGFSTGTITKVVEYKDIDPKLGQFFFVEIDLGKTTSLNPDNYVQIMPLNPRSEVESLVSALYPGLINTPITLVPMAKCGGDEELSKVPSHLTVRQLFEQFIDLSRQPSLLFMQQMEARLDDPERDVVQNRTEFLEWVQGKNYFQALKMYKSVIPSIEVLISMLPLMIPRCYTPLHIEPPQPRSVGICVKRVPGGLCSNYLINSKKGDKVMLAFGPSFLSRASDLYLQGRMGFSAALPAVDVIAPPIASLGKRQPTVATDVLASVREAPLEASAPRPLRKDRTLEDLDFPLTFSSSCLFASLSRRVPVDEVVIETFEISNLQDEKFRFTLEPIVNDKLSITFDPTSGIIKKKNVVSIKAILIAYCTSSIDTAVRVFCETLTKSAQSAVCIHKLAVKTETKICPKLDFMELALGKKVGEGTFGTVFRAEWRGQSVAVKMVKDTDDREFANEVRLLQEIHCQYVVNFVGYCLRPPNRCLVTEFMELGSLASHIYSGKLDTEYRFKVIHDCARGLQFLHEYGTLHRDIKPGNILLVSLNFLAPVVCKVSDFGTSAPIASISEDTKHEPEGVGTPSYMSPEILDGRPYTPAADVYSLSILMWELMTAQDPYPTKQFPSPWYITKHVLEGKRPTIPSTVPALISTLIQSCWNKDPKRRPTSSAIVEELVGVLTMMGIPVETNVSRQTEQVPKVASVPNTALEKSRKGSSTTKGGSGASSPTSDSHSEGRRAAKANGKAFPPLAKDK